MDLLSGLRKGDTSRGGRAEFSWDSVKEDKDRENYLGHSLMAPVGRWQRGKDLNWYAKASDNPGDADAQRREEIRRIKEAEQDAIAAALGYPVQPRIDADHKEVDSKEVEKAIRDARAGSDREEERGVGFGKRGGPMEVEPGTTDERGVERGAERGVERGGGGIVTRDAGRSDRGGRRDDSDGKAPEKSERMGRERRDGKERLRRHRSRSRSRGREDRDRRHRHRSHSRQRERHRDERERPREGRERPREEKERPRQEREGPRQEREIPRQERERPKQERERPREERGRDRHKRSDERKRSRSRSPRRERGRGSRRH